MQLVQHIQVQPLTGVFQYVLRCLGQALRQAHIAADVENDNIKRRNVTLNRGELMAKMQSVRMPRTLPVVLSRDEVARLIAAAPNLKSQTALSIAYGTGLRASEVIALKVGDIDSERMTLRVEQGKGRKDRYKAYTDRAKESFGAWLAAM